MTWNNVTVSQFVELYSLSLDDFESIDEYHINFFSVLLDLPVEELEDMNYDAFEEMRSQYGFVGTMPGRNHSSVLVLPDVTLYFKPFNRLTIGEFIDLENLFVGKTGKSTYIENFQVILAILYRQLVRKQDSLYIDEYEDYGNWIFHRSPMFSEVSITDVYGIIEAYLNFRARIFEAYAGLFEIEESGDGEYMPQEEAKSLGFRERAEMIEAEKQQKNLKKWGWDLVLLRLANNDPTKYSAATDMQLVKAFNLLSLIKECKL